MWTALSIDTDRPWYEGKYRTNGTPRARRISLLLRMRDHLNREFSLHGDGISVVPKVGRNGFRRSYHNEVDAVLV